MSYSNGILNLRILMLIGIGIDIVDLDRFEEISSNPLFREKYFQPHEQNLKVESLAGRLAAKEAFFKALDIQSLFNWEQILIVSDKGCAPKFEFLGELKVYAKDKRILLSITHSKKSAVAFVIIESI